MSPTQSEEPDENFDNELVVHDPEEAIYKEVVLRREKLLSVSRITMQIMSYICFNFYFYMFVTDMQWKWLIGVALFFVLTVGNAQVLNYRVILPGPASMFRKGEE